MLPLVSFCMSPTPTWFIHDSFNPKDCHQNPEISPGGKFWPGNLKICIWVYAPWKKSYNQPRQHIKKQRHYFAGKGPSSQSYGFSSSHVEMWELDFKKAEHWRIDALELWCWRRLLRVPWTARRSNQSILQEISPEYSLEELMLKLKLQ